jgi:N-acyl-phosphatidylethanolamine-hydrolysing phospholipase D
MALRKRYKNPYKDKLKRSLVNVALWKCGFYNDKQNVVVKPDEFKHEVELPNFEKEKPSVMWVNHSSFLVNIKGCNILTDPIWSEFCSPVSFIGPKRLHSPGISIDDLPPIDFVILSHNHYDHMDIKTILELKKRFSKIIWVVPLGLKKWFNKRKITNVFELNWWEDISFVKSANEKIKITCVPSQHYSGRGLLDFNHTLWGGFVFEVLEKGNSYKKFYFVGDTGYNDYDFKKIGEKWNGIDLSLIPIGAYIPKRFMETVHVNPQNAVRIHQEIKSKFSIGMHWKTFHLSDEPKDQPPYDLFLELNKANIPVEEFISINPGRYVNW